MSAAREDPADTFTKLYEGSYGAIYAYAARRVGSQAADEIAAETFLVAWRRWDAMPAASLPWLYGVARNVIARHHTASGRQRAIETALAHERTLPEPGGYEPGD